MGLGESDPLGEVLREADRAKSTLDFERKQKKAGRAAKKSREEDLEAMKGAGERARGQVYRGKPITSFFELLLILLILMGVGGAAVVWQQFFGDDEEVTATASGGGGNTRGPDEPTAPSVSSGTDISGNYTLAVTVTGPARDARTPPFRSKSTRTRSS